MSEARPKRAPRESTPGIGRKAIPAEPNPDTPPFIPETATAPVALETATAVEPAAEPAPATKRAAKTAATAAADDPWAGAWAVWIESQSALARGFEALATEVSGMTRSGIAAASETATAALGAKTLAEAIEINAGLARRGFDETLASAAKLSEIGVKAATEASRPILNRLSESWKSLSAHY